jgi:sugar/nucleoside kinase (ribokinase family)
MALRVLVVGNVTLDRYGEAWLPGGSAYYAGHTWRELGAEVRVITAAGPEFPAGALDGLDARIAGCVETTRFANAHHPDGTRTQRVEARAPQLDPGSLPAAWRDCDVLHLAPVLREVDLPAWARAVSAAFVGIGIQGWVREVAPDGAVVQPAWRPDAELLRAHVSAACAGEDDLRGQGELLALLSRAIPVVALTHGERGCEVTARGVTSRVGVYATQAVDPVGAGDVFSAGFFFGLARGDVPQSAARLGAAAASIVVEARAGEALTRVREAFTRCARVAIPG